MVLISAERSTFRYPDLTGEIETDVSGKVILEVPPMVFGKHFIRTKIMPANKTNETAIILSDN